MAFLTAELTSAHHGHHQCTGFVDWVHMGIHTSRSQTSMPWHPGKQQTLQEPCEILKFWVKFLHMVVYIVWQQVKKNLTDQMIHCDAGEGK